MDRHNLKCRLCRNKVNSYIDIFDPTGTNNLLVWKIIKEITELEVSKEDGLPPTICPNCMEKLTAFKCFKTLCITSRIEFLKEFAYEGLVLVPPLDTLTTNCSLMASSFLNTADEGANEADQSRSVADVKTILRNGIVVEEGSHSGCQDGLSLDDGLSISTTSSSHGGAIPKVLRHHRSSTMPHDGGGQGNSQSEFSRSNSMLVSSPRTIETPVAMERPVGDIKICHDAILLNPRRSLRQQDLESCARTTVYSHKRCSAGDPQVLDADGPGILHTQPKKRMTPNPYRIHERKGSWSNSPSTSSCANDTLLFEGHCPALRNVSGSRRDVTGGEKRDASMNFSCALTNHSGSLLCVGSQGKMFDVSKTGSSRDWAGVIIKKENLQLTHKNHHSGVILKDCSVVLNDIFQKRSNVDSTDLIIGELPNIKVEKSEVRNSRKCIKMETDSGSGRYISGRNCGEKSKTIVKHKQVVKTKRFSTKKKVSKNVTTENRSQKADMKTRQIYCRTCNINFTSNYKATKHQFFVHKKGAAQKNYCSICKRNFFYPYLLQEHKKQHEKNLPFLCKKCPCGFTSNTGLQLHLRKFHYYVRQTH